MIYPTGNTVREQNFLDYLRGDQAFFNPTDWERLLHTYRTLGGRD